MLRLILLTSLLTTSAWATSAINYSGRLVNANGSPVTGMVTIDFDLAYSSDQGVSICTLRKTNVNLAQGVFHTKLDFGPAHCGAKTLAQVLSDKPTLDSLMIRVTDVTNSKIYGFQAIHAMPYSIIADRALTLDPMGAALNQVLTWNGTAWVPMDPQGAGGSSPTGVASGDLDGNYPSPIIRDGVITYAKTNFADGSIPLAKVAGLGTSADRDIPGCAANQVLTSDAMVGFACVDDDTTDTTKLPLAGGTLSGALTLAGDPTAPLQAATRQYVDDATSASVTDAKIVSVSGSKVTGNIPGSAVGFTGNLAGDVTGPQGTTVVERIRGTGVSASAPATDQVLKFNGTVWAPGDASPVGTAGGDLTGTYPNPTISNLAATKIAGGAVDNTEFSYLDGVSSNIQSQLAALAGASSKWVASGNDISSANAGNVGIGTATPAARLEVQRTSTSTATAENTARIVMTANPTSPTTANFTAGSFRAEYVSAQSTNSPSRTRAIYAEATKVAGGTSASNLIGVDVFTSLVGAGSTWVYGVNNIVEIQSSTNTQTVVGNRIDVVSNSAQSSLFGESISISQTAANGGQIGLSQSNLTISGSANSSGLIGHQASLSTNGTGTTSLAEIFKGGFSHSRPTNLGSAVLVDGSFNIFGDGNVNQLVGLNITAGDSGNGNFGNIYVVKIPNLPAVTGGKYSIHSLDPNVVMYHQGQVAVGTSTPVDLLTVEGVTALRETTAPTSTGSYGKVYVKASDSKLYFMDDAGAEFDLTATGGAPSGSATGDLSGTYPAPTIAANAVTSAKILNATILGEDIADATIPMAKLTGLGNSAGRDIPTCALNHVLTSDALLGFGCVADNTTDSTKLPLGGGTLTGALTLSGAPTLDLHAATKKYVDDEIDALPISSTFVNGGNSFAAAAVVGTNDANSLSIRTNSVQRIGLSATTGNVVFGASMGATSGNTVYINSADARGDLTLLNSTSGSNGSLDGLSLAQVFENAVFELRENGYMSFATNSSERMRILANGNVGIGTTSATDKLVVAGNATVWGKVEASYTGPQDAFHAHQEGIGNIASFSYGPTWEQKFIITSQGFVGIGMDSPEAKLAISGGSVHLNSAVGTTIPALTAEPIPGEIQSGQNDSILADSGLLRLSAGGGTTLGVKAAIDIFRGATDQSQIRAYTSGAERLRINDVGNVGVGTTAPTAKLDVNGTVKANAISGPWDQSPSGFIRLGAVQIAWGTTGVIPDGGTVSVTFPAAFLAAPSVTVSSNTRGAYLCSTGNSGIDTRTATGITIHAEAGANNVCSWLAIGRWQ